jgi:hypothetical protein
MKCLSCKALQRDILAPVSAAVQLKTKLLRCLLNRCLANPWNRFSFM